MILTLFLLALAPWMLQQQIGLFLFIVPMPKLQSHVDKVPVTDTDIFVMNVVNEPKVGSHVGNRLGIF